MGSIAPQVVCEVLSPSIFGARLSLRAELLPESVYIPERPWFQISA